MGQIVRVAGRGPLAEVEVTCLATAPNIPFETQVNLELIAEKDAFESDGIGTVSQAGETATITVNGAYKGVQGSVTVKTGPSPAFSWTSTIPGMPQGDNALSRVEFFEVKW